MSTYTTLDGATLDLSVLTTAERGYFDRCYAAFRSDSLEWSLFCELVTGPENPLIRASGGWVTPAVSEHILYRAVRDLEDRIGIRQGTLAAEAGDALESEPLTDERPTPAAMTQQRA